MTRARTPYSFVQRKFQGLLRKLRPGEVLEREVQGVDLTLPRSHRLPDYAAWFPEYGQNLVDLAQRLSQPGEPLRVLDVGANIGDSAAQITHAVPDALVLCVEADAYWVDFLRTNAARYPGHISIEQVLLSPDPSAAPVAPVRTSGTTRFAPGTSSDTAPVVTVRDLRRRQPAFSSLRLVKSDTDGYDARLIPAIATAWADKRPVLFFEYDRALSAKAGDDHPEGMWETLAGLGYDYVGIWGNKGRPLGAATVERMWSLTQSYEEGRTAGLFDYWDLAVAHRNDHEGREAIVGVLGTAAENQISVHGRPSLDLLGHSDARD